MENFFLKDGQEDVLKNVLAGQRFDHTKTTTENDIWEFLDELSVGKKIEGFEVLPSKKAILTNGLLSSRRDTPFSTTYKGVNSLLIYMLIRDNQEYDTEYEKPNFKLEDINALLNDCIDTTTVSKTNYGRFRRLIEKFSEDSNFGKCTLEPKKNGESIQVTQVREVELDNSNFFHQNVSTDSGYPKELMHLKKYEKGYQSWYEEFFFTVVRALPFWLKKFLYKERYERIVQVGNSELVRQKIEYYIPLDFEFKGTEYDNLSLQDIKLLQKETKQGLVDYLWKEAIKGGKRKYHFIFGGIGQGKTALLVKLYAQYHRFLFDFIDNRIVVYFNIDENLETKLDIFSKQVEYIENKTGDQYETVVLLDALDEDYEANINVSKRLSDLKKILDKYNRVVITCRTQFFDSNEHLRNKIEGIFKYEDTKIIYIQKFKPKQINKYLKKRYKFGSQERKIANELIDNFCDKKDFISQPLLLSFIDLLVDKKMDNRLDIQYKSQLYKYIIDRWQEKEAIKKSSSKSHIESYKNKVYDVAHQVAINIYKRDIVKVANLENQPHKIENVLSNEELTILLEKIDKKVLDAKKRSVFMRDSIGNWFFVHKSFLEFFIGHAAYQILEFDTIFEYHKGFNPYEKKHQNSAAFFYTELMWLKIQETTKDNVFNKIQYVYGINKIGAKVSRGIKSLRIREISLIEYILVDNFIDLSVLSTGDSVGSLRNLDLSDTLYYSLLQWIRCFKNLKEFELSETKSINFSPLMLGSMSKLEKLQITKSHSVINVKELERFKNIHFLEIADSIVQNIHFILNFSKLTIVSFEKSQFSSIEYSKLKSSNNIERLLISNSGIGNIEFVENWNSLKQIGMYKVPFENLKPIEKLSNLNKIQLSQPSFSDLEILRRLAAYNPKFRIKVEFTDTNRGHFISLLKPCYHQISYLSFKGINLSKGQIESLFESKTLYLDENSISNEFSKDSIDELRTFTSNKLMYIYVNNIPIEDWRSQWNLIIHDPEKKYELVTISTFKKFYFEKIYALWYRIHHFADLTNFTNLKEIVISYIPNHQELRAVFTESKNRKSLTIFEPQTQSLDLRNIQHVFFDEFKIHDFNGEIVNLAALRNTKIENLTFSSIPQINLFPLLRYSSISEFHLHRVNNAINLSAFLHFLTINQGATYQEQVDGSISVSMGGMFGKVICFSNCGIKSSDLVFLKECQSIGKLKLHNNQITDISIFNELHKVIAGISRKVNLSNNPIEDISPLDRYSWSKLEMNNCLISYIPKFEDFFVNEIEMKKNPLTNIDNLRYIKGLCFLNLSGCVNIESFECLKHLDSLVTLNINIREHHVPQLLEAFQEHEYIKKISIKLIDGDLIKVQEKLSPIKHLIKQIWQGH